nr:uncharacterized protein LOC111419136 [Onthophagus taurus]
MSQNNDKASDERTCQTVPCATTRREESARRDYVDSPLPGLASQGSEYFAFRRSSLLSRSPPKNVAEEPESISSATSETDEDEEEVGETLNNTVVDTLNMDLESQTPERVRHPSFDGTLERKTPMEDKTPERDRKKRKRMPGHDSSEKRNVEEENENAKSAATVKKGIENMINLVKSLKQNEEQNTKREMKRIIKQMQRQVEVFERDEIKKWVDTAGERKEFKIPGREKCTQTETEEDRRKNDEVNKIRNARTFEDWVKTVDMKWPEESFEKTNVKEGNPLWQREITTRVVIVEPDDPDMDKSIQNQYRRAYPELSEICENYEEIEQITRKRIRGEERESKEKVVKLMTKGTDDSIWKALEELRRNNTSEKKIAIHHLRQIKLTRFRKMLEVVFKDSNTEIEIYTTQTKIDEEERDVKKDNERKTYAIIVERPGKTYEETVEGIRSRLEEKREAEIIEEIRSTRDGKVLITTQKEEKAARELQNVLRNEKGQTVTGRGMGRREGANTVINIKGLMITTGQGEIKQAIIGKTGEIDEANFKMSSLRPYAGSMMAVTVELKTECAQILIREKKIRVGLAMCRVEERKRATRCWRCWSTGHLARDCNGPDRTNCCYNCGEEGHQLKECKNPPNCPKCGAEGHRAGSGGCKTYRRQAQQETQRKKQFESKEETSPKSPTEKAEKNDSRGEQMECSTPLKSQDGRKSESEETPIEQKLGTTNKEKESKGEEWKEIKGKKKKQGSGTPGTSSTEKGKEKREAIKNDQQQSKDNAAKLQWKMGLSRPNRKGKEKERDRYSNRSGAELKKITKSAYR